MTIPAYTCWDAIQAEKRMEPRDYNQQEAILTIIHEDGTTTRHPIYVETLEDEDIFTAYLELRYEALNPAELEEAERTQADCDIELWDDVDNWAGPNPFHVAAGGAA